MFEVAGMRSVEVLNARTTGLKENTIHVSPPAAEQIEGPNGAI